MPKRRRNGRSYFRIPKSGPRGFSSFGRLGESTGLHRSTALFLMAFVGIMVYTTFLLPGINDFRCGEAYNEEYAGWYAAAVAFDTANQPSDVFRSAYAIKSDPARLEALRSLDTDPLTDFPECVGIVPSGDSGTSKILTQTLRILVDFLPLLSLVPILFLVFRQMGNIGTLPVFLLTLALRELIPGDGIVDWIILLVGIIVACIPIPVAGLLAALSHLGALALWPTMILAYTTTTGEVDDIISSPIRLLLEFVIWVVPFGILAFLPIRWKMVDNEVVV